MIPDHIDANELIQGLITPTELYEIKEGIREQLRKGIINPNIATEAQRAYSPYSAKLRRRKGLPTNFVNLNCTGQLYRSVFVSLVGMTLNTDNFAQSYEDLLDDPKTGPWAIHSMDVSRPIMDRLREKIYLKATMSII